MKIQGEARSVTRIGLDAEALPRVTWDRVPYHRFGIMWSWGTEGDISTIEADDYRPGIFKARDLLRLRTAVTQEGVIVVGHNALKYDLPLLNGILEDHGLKLLPNIDCQDTLTDWKWGGGIRNSLKARCAAAKIQLKGGSPDWDRIMQGYADEWAAMKEYNRNDVVCTLQLEEWYRKTGRPVAVKTWKPTGR